MVSKTNRGDEQYYESFPAPLIVFPVRIGFVGGKVGLGRKHRYLKKYGRKTSPFHVNVLRKKKRADYYFYFFLFFYFFSFLFILSRILNEVQMK
jgi:hypothetical protein